MSASRGDCHRLALRARILEYGERQCTGGGLNRDVVSVGETHFFRGRRVHLGDCLPADLRYWLWNLLEPRFVRAAPISEERMRIDNQVHVPARLLDRCGSDNRRNRPRGGGGS